MDRHFARRARLAPPGVLAALAVSAIVAAGVLTPVSATRATVVTLEQIASKVDARAGVVTIQSSDPVAYVASQPDPRSFVVELRDVVAAGFADRFTPDPRNPIAGVQVESARAEDGVAIARVRMALTHPMRPKVRSSRNVIYVEAPRPEAGGGGAAAISMAGPSTVIREVSAEQRGGATRVSFLGTGVLEALRIEPLADNPRRLVLSFANVTSALPAVTPIGRGPVERVRIGLAPNAPLITQATIELSHQAAYRVEPSATGQSLTLVFDAPQDPMLALAARPDAQAAQAPVAPAAPIQIPVVQTPAPAVPVASPTTQVPVAPPATRYTGHPISLDFQGANLRAVLRTFSEISGLNIVIDPSVPVDATVDVALRDVPWDQAIEIILRANRLGYSADGTIVRIASLEALAAEEAQRQRLVEAQALSGELRVFTRPLSYARADDLRQLLTSTVLSSRGTVQVDARTNTIIVSDLADRLTRASDLLNTLDVPQPQVEIEARIVQTTREFARNLGVQWGFGGRASTALGNTLPLAFPNQGSLTGRTGGLQGPVAPDPGADAANTAVNLGVQGASSAIGLALGSINGAVNLDVVLSALERQGQGRILSTPRVFAQNNKAAEITQGVEIPIQTVANNTVTVTFRPAALTLRVTPQITAANTVIMDIQVENAAPDFSRQVNQIPPIDTQRATTQVLVSNGETTVIGGIYVSREQSAQDRTPGLHRLPLLGWLFRRDTVSDESRELLIFITPRIQRL